MNLSAKLLEILLTKSGLSINGRWSKQEIVVETTDDYPKKVCISIWNGRVDISELEVGKEYLFHVNVESKEHKGKWYTELTLWKIGWESTVQTGRPLLDIMSPILNGNESNLEIIQKFQEEICTILVYTKGIRVGNKVSDEELIIDTRVLDYIARFKKWMNEVAFSYIMETINKELLNKDGFQKYPKVVQKYLINTILETYYGYKPKDEDSDAEHAKKPMIEDDTKEVDLLGENFNPDQPGKNFSIIENRNTRLTDLVDPDKKLPDTLKNEILKDLGLENQTPESK